MGRSKKKKVVGPRSRGGELVASSDSESSTSARTRSRSASRDPSVASGRTWGDVVGGAVQKAGVSENVYVRVVKIMYVVPVSSVSAGMNEKPESMDVSGSANVLKRKVCEDASVDAPDAAGKKRVTEMEKMKLIGDELRGYLLSESTKVSKGACDVIMRKVSEYERMLGELIIENANLKGRLAMTERVNVRASGTYASVAAAAPGALAQPQATGANVGVHVGVNRPTVRPSFAVVVKGGEKDSSEDVKKKLVTGVNSSLNVRVKAVRALKNGGMIVETASAIEKERLKKCDKIASVGPCVEEPKRMLPRMIVYDVPNEPNYISLLVL